MRKYTLSEEVAMYEKALGIRKKPKPSVCPLCGVHSGSSDQSNSVDKDDTEKINNKKS
jgi:hypothetical protein